MDRDTDRARAIISLYHYSIRECIMSMDWLFAFNGYIDVVIYQISYVIRKI